MKLPKFEPKIDENGDLRLFLFSANGHEMFRSTDAIFKVGNCKRTAERVKAMLTLISDEAIINAMMQFRKEALKAVLKNGKD